MARSAGPVARTGQDQAGPAPGWRRRFKSLRVAILLGALFLAAMWAARQQLLRQGRRAWRSPVLVDVVLLQRGNVSPAALTSLGEALPRLEELLYQEFVRYRPMSVHMRPFLLAAHGPVPVSAPPPELPEDAAPWERATHFLRLRHYLKQAQAQMTLRRNALQLYVVVEPVRTRVRFVEGFGAMDGDFGVVRAAIDERTVDQALLAIAHEMLHCVGATDKYDDQGHAAEPAGLAEPGRAPRYPQRFAEVMVGELPLAPRLGRLVESLAEVRVGPVTAAEIGWLTPPPSLGQLP